MENPLSCVLCQHVYGQPRYVNDFLALMKGAGIIELTQLTISIDTVHSETRKEQKIHFLNLELTRINNNNPRK